MASMDSEKTQYRETNEAIGWRETAQDSPARSDRGSVRLRILQWRLDVQTGRAEYPGDWSDA